jgi:hypothetical protein
MLAINRWKQRTNAASIDSFVVPVQTLVTSGDAETVLNAVEGSIGILTPKGTFTDTSVPKEILTALALSAGDKFRVFQHQGLETGLTDSTEPQMHSSTQVEFKTGVVTKRVYDAGRDQINIASVIPSASTPTSGDFYEVTFVDRTKQAQQYLKYSFSTTAKVNDSFYGILSRIAAKVGDKDNGAYHAWSDFRFSLYRMRVLGGTPGSNLTGAATVVNGSTSVTSTSHGLGVNDFVRIAGDVYKVVSTATNSFVIDRAYAGASGSVANTLVQDMGTSAGDLGFTLESNYREIFSVAVSEQFYKEGIEIKLNDTTTFGTVTASTYKEGSGHADLVAMYERNGKAMQGFLKGNLFEYNQQRGKPVLYANSAKFYTVYNINGYKTEPTYSTASTATEPVQIQLFCEQTNATTPGGLVTALDTIFGL